MKNHFKSIFIVVMCAIFLSCSNTNLKSEKQIQNEINKISDSIRVNNGNSNFRKLISKQHINGIDSLGKSLLSNAIRAKNISLVTYLLEQGADPNLRNRDFLISTPLMQCTNVNFIEAAKVLIDFGADVNVVDKQNDPAIHWSAYYGQVEMTQLFLDNGANPNIKSIHSDGVLHVAMKEWKDEVVEMLIDKKVSFKSLSDEEAEIVEIVKKGAINGLKKISNLNANITDEAGSPLIVIAASKGKYEMVKYLVEKGADINAMNITGHSALNRAVYFGNEKTVQYLIREKADVNKTDERFKLNPLIAASRTGKSDLAKLLLENGAKIDAVNGIDGMSPVMWAVGYGHKETVKTLLSYNPNLNLVSKYNSTVFDLAQDDEIKKILLNK